MTEQTPPVITELPQTPKTTPRNWKRIGTYVGLATLGAAAVVLVATQAKKFSGLDIPKMTEAPSV